MKYSDPPHPYSQLSSSLDLPLAKSSWKFVSLSKEELASVCKAGEFIHRNPGSTSSATWLHPVSGMYLWVWRSWLLRGSPGLYPWLAGWTEETRFGGGYAWFLWLLLWFRGFEGRTCSFRLHRSQRCRGLWLRGWVWRLTKGILLLNGPWLTFCEEMAVDWKEQSRCQKDVVRRCIHCQCGIRLVEHSWDQSFVLLLEWYTWLLAINLVRFSQCWQVYLDFEGLQLQELWFA